MADTTRSSRDVFCNFPFDTSYERLYTAMVAALLCTGHVPRTVLELPAHANRLDRLVGMVQDCPYSVHDLSRVQLSAGAMRVPRFNVPFELGLAVAVGKCPPTTHQFRVLETKPHRLQHSLSDLNGYDPYIHFGTVDGMFEAIGDMFIARKPYPIDDVTGFRRVYRALRVFRRQRFGSKSPYTPGRFAELVVAGARHVQELTI